MEVVGRMTLAACAVVTFVADVSLVQTHAFERPDPSSGNEPLIVKRLCLAYSADLVNI